MAADKIPFASFQAYQLAFTKRLRAPEKYPIPAGAASTRMAIYEDLIFNNLSESVSVCFPVAKSILGDDGWAQVMRLFFAKHSSNSPLFREIPEEFVNFLAALDLKDERLPPFLLSLCHYEWIELSLSTQNNHNEANQIAPINEAAALLDNNIRFVSPMALLNYDFPVHTISPDNQPSEPVATQLLVYRDAHDDIQFIELNTMTYELIRLLDQEKMSTRAALTHIAGLLGETSTTKITTFGLDILFDFYQQGIIVGLETALNEDTQG